MKKKRRPLLFLGIIAAASMTLTAFEWRSPREMLKSMTGIGDQIKINESDLQAIIIEQEVKQLVLQKTAKTSLT